MKRETLIRANEVDNKLRRWEAILEGCTRKGSLSVNDIHINNVTLNSIELFAIADLAKDKIAQLEILLTAIKD